jgi:hypothetical protein
MARVVVLALALVAAAHGGVSRHRTVVIKPRGTPRWLVRDAYKFSGWLADPTPRRIRITLGRFDTIAIRGRFVCTKCFGIWTKPPRGTLARYVIDPRTRGVVSFGLGH